MSSRLPLSGTTKPFAVLGHPIGHTLSPLMHNAAFRARGMDAVYLAFDVAPDRLMGVLGSMRDMGFAGVNLTVPLKEVAFNGLETKDESARRLGAVNTVEFLADGSLVGHNTDGAGFSRAINEAFGAEVKGLTVFVLGCGGAGRAVAITCAAQGASRLVLTDVDQGRALRVRDEIADQGGPPTQTKVCPPDADTWIRECRQADLVIQATPVGMKKGDRSLLDPEAFREGQLALDLVYMYPETRFTEAARGGGAKAVNGIGMLLHQGAKAFTIWTGKEPPVQVMREALENAVYGT